MLPPLTCCDHIYTAPYISSQRSNLSDLLIGHFYQIDRTRDKTAQYIYDSVHNRFLKDFACVLNPERIRKGSAKHQNFLRMAFFIYSCVPVRALFIYLLEKGEEKKGKKSGSLPLLRKTYLFPRGG